MSRIGRQPIPVPKGVDVQIAGDVVSVKGPKGQLQVGLLPGISVAIDDGIVNVSRADDEGQTRSYHGLVRALLANATTGVSEGWSKELEIVGIGYRAESKGKTVIFNLGFSHTIDFAVPEGIDIDVDASPLCCIDHIERRREDQQGDGEGLRSSTGRPDCSGNPCVAAA